MVMGQQNVTCVGWRNRSIMVILFCRECCKYDFLQFSQTKTYPARDMSNIFEFWKRLSVQHVVYEVKFSVSVKSQKNKKARLSCSRAYKYRVMTFLLRLCRASQETQKKALLTGLACTKELTDFSWRDVW